MPIYEVNTVKFDNAPPQGEGKVYDPAAVKFDDEQADPPAPVADPSNPAVKRAMDSGRRTLAAYDTIQQQQLSASPEATYSNEPVAPRQLMSQARGPMNVGPLTRAGSAIPPAAAPLQSSSVRQLQMQDSGISTRKLTHPEQAKAVQPIPESDAYDTWKQGLDVVEKDHPVLEQIVRPGRGMIAGAAGAVEGAAGLGQRLGIPGSEKVGDTARQVAQDATVKNKTFTDDIYSGAGSMLTFMVPGMGIGKAAALLSKVPKLANWAAALSSAGIEAGTEGGQVYRDMIAKGASPEDAVKASDAATALNMVLIGATNKLGIFGDRAAGVKKTLLSALLEGGQEAGQEVISSKAKGENIDPEAVLRSGGVGAIIGGGMGAVMPKDISTPSEKGQTFTHDPFTLKRMTALGYSPEDIAALKPREAKRIINKGQAKPVAEVQQEVPTGTEVPPGQEDQQIPWQKGVDDVNQDPAAVAPQNDSVWAGADYVEPAKTEKPAVPWYEQEASPVSPELHPNLVSALEAMDKKPAIPFKKRTLNLGEPRGKDLETDAGKAAWNEGMSPEEEQRLLSIHEKANSGQMPDVTDQEFLDQMERDIEERKIAPSSGQDRAVTGTEKKPATTLSPAPQPIDFALQGKKAELEDYGVPDMAAALEKSKKHVKITDTLTGWVDKHQDEHTQALYDWSHSNDADVASAHLDLSNLGGLNESKGHAQADKHIKAVTDIIRRNVEAAGIKDAHFKRSHAAGDELSIEAPGASKEALDEALKKADNEVKKYVADNGLTGIKGKKYPEGKDFGFSSKVVNMRDFKGMSFEEFQKINDAKLEKPEAVRDVERIKADEIGASASEGQAGRIVEGPEQDRRGDAEEVPASEGQDLTPEQPKPVVPATPAVKAETPAAPAEEPAKQVESEKSSILPEGMKSARTVQSIVQSGVKTMLIKDVNRNTIRNIKSGEMTPAQAIEYLRRNGVDVLKKMPAEKVKAEQNATDKENLSVQMSEPTPASPDKDLLSYMRDRIDMSEAGQRSKDEATGEWTGIKSSFPEWYRKAGFSGKKQALAIINKAIETGEIKPQLQDAINKGAALEYKELQKTRLQGKILGEGYDEQSIHERTQSQGFGSLIEAAQDIVGRGIRADEGAAESSGETRQRESEALKKWAEEHGVLIPSEPFTEEWKGTEKIAGKERQVIYDSFSNTVLKRKKILSSETYGSYLTALQIHNDSLEPRARIELIGFSEVKGEDGVTRLMSVERQPFIQGRPATMEEIDAEMHRRGFTGDGGRYYDKFTGVRVNDLGTNNAIRMKDGAIVIIDADIIVEAQEKTEEKPSSFSLTPDESKEKPKKQAPAASDLFGAGFTTIAEGKKPAGEEKLTELEQAQENQKAEEAKIEFEGKQGDLLGDKGRESGKIEDFGQKLGGAKKDRQPSLDVELTDADIRNKPLSEIWPKKEVDDIEDPFIAAIATAARAEIPAKPRVGYKLNRWVEKVKSVRELAKLVQGKALSREEFFKKAKDYKLEHFTAKVQLLESLDRSQWDRIGKVGEHPNSYRYGERTEQGYEKIPSPFSDIEIDGKTQIYKVGSIMEALSQIQEALGIEQVAKGMQFEVRGRGTRFFVNKKGDPLYRPLKTFDNSKDALDFARDKRNQDELVKAWEDIKEKENVKERDTRSDTNKPRVGADHRKGKDATPEMFSDAFGFRGVEFGNWVSQGSNKAERQGMLNSAYDAMMDLSKILNIPAKALSLNGSMGLGFGSRGSGWASAHYEPDTLVINLTKTRGAGSLAHELFHAIDHYFQRQRGADINLHSREQTYITYAPEIYYRDNRTGHRLPANRFNELKEKSLIRNPGEWTKVEGIRPEVSEAFTDLVKALNDSPMAKRSALIDKGKSGGYWSRIIERAARSFENYVIYKMQQQGYHNDYLANVITEKDFVRDIGRYPYLLESEIAPVAEAFDNLFSTIKTKETDKGVMLYSGIPVDAILDELRKAKNTYPHLVSLGKNVIREGYIKIHTFSVRMKELLGDMWNRFREQMPRIFAEAKKALNMDQEKTRQWNMTRGLQLPKVSGPVTGSTFRILSDADIVKPIWGTESDVNLYAGIHLPEAVRTVVNALKGTDAYKKVAEIAEDKLGTISDRLERISPRIQQTMRDYDLKVRQQDAADLAAVTPLLEAVKKVQKASKSDMETLTAAMFTGDSAGVSAILKKYDLEGVAKDFRAWDDAKFKALDAAGIDTNYLREHYTRSVKDHEGLLEYYMTESGQESGLIQLAFKQKESETGRPLTDAERIEIINKLMRGYHVAGVTLRKPGQLKERLIDTVTPEMLKFYNPFSDGLINYIHAVNQHMAARELFGKGIGSNLQSSLGAVVDSLMQQGNITTWKNQAELQKLVQTYFDIDKTHKAIRVIKNLTIIDNMGSIVTTFNNLKDIWNIALQSGLLNTTVATKDVLLGKGEKLEKLALEVLGEEFRTNGIMSRAVNTTLKGTGFQAVESFSSKVALNAGLIKYKKMAKDNPAEFIKEMEPYFGEDKAKQMMNDLLAGKLGSDPVTQLAFKVMSDIKPVSRLEYPVGYHEANLGKLMYSLKTYFIKQQMSYLRKNVFRKWEQGDHAAAVRNFAKYTIYIGVLGGVMDSAKDWMLGRNIRFSDTLIDQLGQMFFIPRYSTWKVRQDPIWGSIQAMVATPRVMTSLFHDAEKVQAGRFTPRNAETMQDIPILGKPVYWKYGGGADKTLRYQRKRLVADILSGQIRVTDPSVTEYNRDLAERNRVKTKAEREGMPKPITGINIRETRQREARKKKLLQVKG